MNPYEAHTTLTIDRANRLIGLKSHPGYMDLIRISEACVGAAEDSLVQYDGWDKDDLIARSIAFRAAKKFHEQLFARVNNLIEVGISESISTAREAINNDAAMNMADDLRVSIMRNMEDTFDSRVPGSY